MNMVPLELKSPAGAGDVGSPCGEERSFLDWLLQKANLDARAYNGQTLSRRLPACLRTLRVRTCREARKLLELSPSLIPAAISTLIIGVTSFFRDDPVFEMIGSTILPNLVAARSDLRIWSAGCSEGAEIYSIAMMLAERGAIHRTELLGTDCRIDAIARARRGHFDPAMIKGISPAIMARYFRQDGNGWRIDEPIRRAVQWRTANVLRQLEPGQWDMILCRNMGMYLNPDSASQLWKSVESLLRPGGMLVLGKAERPHGARQLTAVAPCIYRRR